LVSGENHKSITTSCGLVNFWWAGLMGTKSC